MSRYELLIIGGGINGLGIAAAAANRGLSVLLVEKGDFGGGTTSASSRLIHGGLRYLQYGEIGLVRESLRERGILARQRPHLVRPIQLLIPSFRGFAPAAWQVGTGLFLYDLLARDPLFARPRHLTLDQVRKHEPGLQERGLTGGFLYPDAQLAFPERLCVELMRETVMAGGEVRSHTRMAALREENRRVTGALLRDELTGEEREVEAALTINAAGPWVDAVNRLLSHPPPPQIGGTWGTHLVLPPREDGPRGHLYAAARKDGRPFFILPWDGRLLVGTTDVRFEGDPDDLRVQDWEVEYLLAETNTLFPACRYTEADVQLTTIGVRPLPRSDRSAAAITRRHFVVDHGARHGLHGLASVVGGKLTTYRSLAEEVLKWAVGNVKCQMSNVKWSELDSPVLVVEALEREVRDGAVELGLSTDEVSRLVRLYGPYCREVLALAARRPELRRPLALGCPALAAEVVHAVENESARTVDDILLRRLMLLPPSSVLRDEVRRVCREEGLQRVS